LPLRITTSFSMTSATRSSRRCFPAYSTAFLAASAQLLVLVPMSSITSYVLSGWTTLWVLWAIAHSPWTWRGSFYAECANNRMHRMPFSGLYYSNGRRGFPKRHADQTSGCQQQKTSPNNMLGVFPEMLGFPVGIRRVTWSPLGSMLSLSP